MTKKTDNDNAPPDVDVLPPAVESPDVDQIDDGDDEDGVSALDASLAGVNAEIDGLDRMMADTNARKAALTAQRDAIIEARDANRDPRSNTFEIRRYLDSQQAAREARGEQWRRVREAGVDIKALLPPRPPVDQRPKRPRG